MPMHSLCTQIYEIHTHTLSTSQMVATQVWLECEARRMIMIIYVHDNDHGATMSTGKKLRSIIKWIVSFSIIIISISRVAFVMRLSFPSSSSSGTKETCELTCVCKFCALIKVLQQASWLDSALTHTGALECTWHRFGARLPLTIHLTINYESALPTPQR